MSYSFVVSATSKNEAKQKIADEFAKVVLSQPTHESDQIAAVAVGQAFIDVLEDPKEGQEIYVHMNGSLGWHHGRFPKELTHASVSVNASLRAKSD